MGKIYDEIPDNLVAFIQKSKMFFVATSPLNGGSVNVSPKANEGTFEYVNKNRVRYMDLTGSGNETISHLLEPGNGRITMCFINIEEGLPNIVRLYGKGTVYERGTDEQFDQKWQEVHNGEKVPVGGRAIIDIAVHTCSTSCGYSMPIYEFKRKRTVLDDVISKYEKFSPEQLAKTKGEKVPENAYLLVGGDGKQEYKREFQSGLETYWAVVNNLSIDGLPGLRSVRDSLNKEQQQKLMDKRQRHDQLQAPQEDLGPIKPVQPQDQTQPQAKVKSITSNPTSNFHLFIAFTLGCALTAALFLAQQRSAGSFMNISL
ncbi:uncharacterized protein FA14DRAFT_162271 [Meira miltonrushii]|uniref:Pyridoxamine 5'-phosphate oxidase N-terminal domain-containing protein n=1 Tax=Meira miltonrushii TaxID=1280837 RepID=A0A316V637_9BASI|nr:uncharacterized protein FA14DRAFT_162271 [Meira miltonrushii]PWN31941.1 hypothetical protein FA14DRAFT_162271 [Meira miltonrushii]